MDANAHERAIISVNHLVNAHDDDDDGFRRDGRDDGDDGDGDGAGRRALPEPVGIASDVECRRASNE